MEHMGTKTISGARFFDGKHFSVVPQVGDPSLPRRGHQWAQGVAIVMGPKELVGFHGESCEQWMKERGTPS